MANTDSHVTIYMAASRDGFSARKDGSVDWLETSDELVGGGVVSGECLRLGLADEVRYSILPILFGDGIPSFEKLDRDVFLHLAEVKAYESGMVEVTRCEGWPSRML
jgi:dihydrofolate reductase